MKQNPTSLIQFETTTPPFRAAIALLFACFWFLPTMQAVSPAPDGGYPGGNTAEGQNALLNLAAEGVGYNTAVGYFSLGSDTTGGYNTGVGAGTLLANTGDLNTATGAGALLSNTIGTYNTANGVQALILNTEGNANTATGIAALFHNTIGGYNTANGIGALAFNTTGVSNTAVGVYAGNFVTTGNFNTAVGDGAGENVSTANNVIAIGAGIDGENVSNTCYIGNIFGVSSAGATTVYVNSLGKLGTVVSSRRFKDDIKPMDKASEAILALKPVTFRYKHEIDPTRSPQFGLVAEEVEKVNPALVVRDSEGKINTVRYEAVNAMLLNEFLKEHRKVEQQGRKMQEQEASITQLKSTMTQQQKESQSIAAQQQKDIQALTATLKDQALLIQKVNDKVELNRPAPQVVKNP
jgi:hypothetical protein